MTRARYYLFIPWIYLRHEQKRTPSSEIARLARKDEIALIEALIKGGDREGVIGVDARSALKRLPSAIYWQSLGVLGIKRLPGSLENYHRAMDSFYRKEDVIRGDDKHVIVGGNLRRWDPSIPVAPEDVLKIATLRLRKVDANYLRERVIQSAPHSLFAFLVSVPFDASRPKFPWDHELADEFPERNQHELMHARFFAETMHGSALLYNLMLAEKKKDEARIELYRTRFREWASLMAAKDAALRDWNQRDFWKLIHGTGAKISPKTESFVDVWLRHVIGKDAAGLEHSKTARTAITERERLLKGGLARLLNARALDLWGGASSSARLDYRWNRPVQNILADIREALDA